MTEYRLNERLFNLDALERSNWRSRINQLKRELRMGEGDYASSPSSGSGATTTSQRPAKRRGARPPRFARSVP
jgi:hypothetical protein